MQQVAVDVASVADDWLDSYRKIDCDHSSQPDYFQWQSWTWVLHEFLGVEFERVPSPQDGAAISPIDKFAIADCFVSNGSHVHRPGEAVATTGG